MGTCPDTVKRLIDRFTRQADHSICPIHRRGDDRVRVVEEAMQ
jgi:hypothetical protein